MGSTTRSVSTPAPARGRRNPQQTKSKHVNVKLEGAPKRKAVQLAAEDKDNVDEEESPSKVFF